MPQTTATFRILTKNSGGLKEARVRPASDIVTKSGTTPLKIVLRNRTDSPANVLLPGGVFDDSGFQPNPFVITLDAKGGANDERTLIIDGTAMTKPRLYNFKVFCHETFDFAQGNSDPEFIIEN
jgi:hypothetical protein